MTVKFSREKRVDNYGDEYTIHVHNGTYYLPKLFVENTGYGYTVYVYDDNCKECNGSRMRLSNFSTFRKIAQVRDWLENYDEKMDETIAKEIDDELAKEKSYHDYKENIYSAGVDLITGVFDEEKPVVGSELYIKLLCDKTPSPAKVWYSVNCGDTNAKKWDDPDNFCDWRKTRSKIGGVVELTSSEYNEFVTSGYIADGFSKYEGGNGIDDPRFEEISDAEFMNMPRDSELWKIWMEESYELLTAFYSPGKKIVYVSTQGYDYARYIGMTS